MGRGSQNVTFQIYGKVFLLSVDMYLFNSEPIIGEYMNIIYEPIDGYTVVIHPCFSMSSISLSSTMRFRVSDSAFNKSKSFPSLTVLITVWLVL